MKLIRSVVVILCLILTSSCGDEPVDRIENMQTEAVTFAVFGNSGMALDDGATLASLTDHLDDSAVDFAVDLGNRLPPGMSSLAADAFLTAVDADREQFPCPVYVLAGRNDIFDYDSDIAFTERYGPQWYAFSRSGTAFIMLSTEDGAYAQGFGVKPTMSVTQLDWLENYLESCTSTYKVLFMHRPIWSENSALWRSELRPILTQGGVDLIITCSEVGLMDLGHIDGFRLITTGCTGPVDQASPGLFPHFLTITVDNGAPEFKLLNSDGTLSDGIPIDSNVMERRDSIASALTLDPFKNDNGWNVSQSLNIEISNTFDEAVSGAINFKSYKGTNWSFEPPGLTFMLEPGIKTDFRIGVKALSPELGPVPMIQTRFNIGDKKAFEAEDEIRVMIPSQRTGDPVPVEAHIADVIPYAFDGNLAIPVEIATYDMCGRCIIYRKNGADPTECVYITPLKNFRPGMNEFRWNGRDLRGRSVRPDSLLYKVFVYNKRAPTTWVADGPKNPGGTFAIENPLRGLTALTHNESALMRYRIGGSLDNPEAEIGESFGGILENHTLNGFSYGAGTRMYLGTEAGFAAVQIKNSGATLDSSFGLNGYVAFISRRGRNASPPSGAEDYVAVGFGGNSSSTPELVIYDDASGEERNIIDLGVFFGPQKEAPAITAAVDGIYCAHPNHSTVLKLTADGDILWVSDPKSDILKTDSDGRSYTYGIGVDSGGFSYVNTPGYSARCAVIGPDGLGLFRIILVSLPGLRVSSVTPHVSGEKTDGLYFTTRGGDRPYVFHVPFTVRTGLIIDESAFLN